MCYVHPLNYDPSILISDGSYVPATSGRLRALACNSSSAVAYVSPQTLEGRRLPITTGWARGIPCENVLKAAPNSRPAPRPKKYAAKPPLQSNLHRRNMEEY